MSLNPAFSSASAFAASDASFAPEAKFSLNINAFNGNTTNFNRCPAPKPKSLPMPVQPRELPPNIGSSIKPYMIRPM